MKPEVSRDMLILGRESRGLTQKELAEATDISQANISKYEAGVLNVSEEHLEKISGVLNYPANFFLMEEQRFEFGSSCTYHRKRQTMPVRELKKLLAQVNVCRIQVTKLLNGASIDSDNEFQWLDLDDYDGNVAEVAKIVRRTWRLPSGPVASLVTAIENAGGIVHTFSFGTRKLDAISQWLPGLPPMFFINSDMPGERIRFTLAHELGHIILHTFPGNITGDTESERQADQFAAEFLMPGEEIRPLLKDLTFPQLAKLKNYWKVSMAALVKRAYDLSLLTERQYRYYFEQFSKLGYRIKEPNPLMPEKPTLLKEMFEIHQKDLGYSSAELSKMLAMDEIEMNYNYQLDNKILRILKGDLPPKTLSSCKISKKKRDRHRGMFSRSNESRCPYVSSGF